MAVSGLNIQALLGNGRAVRNSDGSYTINNIDQNFITRVEQAIINGRLNQKKQQEQAAINQYQENTSVTLPPVPASKSDSSNKTSQNNSLGQNKPQNDNSSAASDGDNDENLSGSEGGEQYNDGKSTTLFEHLITSASEIFRGLKLIIYAVTGLSIVAIAIGAFFGNLNWKWLGSVIICLLLISAAQGVLNYLTENNVNPAFKLDDTIESAAPRSNALK